MEGRRSDRAERRAKRESAKRDQAERRRIADEVPFRFRGPSDSDDGGSAAVQSVFNSVQKNYLTPGHPTAFAGVGQVVRFYRGQHKRADIERWLSEIKAYGLTREPKAVKKFSPTYVFFPRQMIQVDLLEFGERSARKNDGVRYVCSVIDCFTRRAWLLPVRRKTPRIVAEAFEEWLDLPEVRGASIKIVVSDKGKEFTTREFKALLGSRGIEHRTPRTENHAFFVERFQRTLRTLIYRYMQSRGTERYIDALPKILDTYNNKFHRSIGCTPVEAEKRENRKKVLELVLFNYARNIYTRPGRSRFQRGERVRISVGKKLFKKGARETFSREGYIIQEVDRTKPVYMYSVTRESDGAEVPGRFYERELQAFPRGGEEGGD